MDGTDTVVFANQLDRDLNSSEMDERKEGDTMAIVESIRAGLAFQFKEAIGPRHIEERERHYAMYECDSKLYT